MNDPVNYPEVVLGRPPMEYVSWILEPHSWGGGIELAILSDHFQTELWAVDILTLRFDRFGQDADHARVALLLYSGIHYDALVVAMDPAQVNPCWNPHSEIGNRHDALHLDRWRNGRNGSRSVSPRTKP